MSDEGKFGWAALMAFVATGAAMLVGLLTNSFTTSAILGVAAGLLIGRFVWWRKPRKKHRLDDLLRDFKPEHRRVEEWPADAALSNTTKETET